MAAAVAVATLASGCGSSTANDQNPGGTQPSQSPANAKHQTPGGNHPSPSPSKSAPKGGGAAF